MHPALEVPEVLCIIFEGELTQNDLFHCSLTCRLWGIWAPDTLWRTCRVPLRGVLQRLSPVTITSIGHSRESVAYVEIGNIEEDGWRRFLILSNKITKLIIDYNLGKASLQRIKLAKSTFGGGLFGQLKTINTEVRMVQLDTIRLVTVPSLKRVFLSNIASVDGRTWVANKMPGMAPNVAHFGVNWTFMLEMSQYLALKHIELRSWDVKPRFWDSLAGCPLLRKIVLTGCMNVDFGGLDPGVTWDVGFVCFPALHTLKLRLGRPRTILPLVLRTRMPMLECLWWDALSGPGSRSLDRIVAQLKLYSPKVDTDMLYHINTDARDDNLADSDDDLW